MDDQTLRKHERELQRYFNEARFAAPNPRDFPTWAAFYEAQAAHEAKLGKIEAELDSIARYFML